ncbi:MAG: DUF721 domain-containing protein [Treponema sp.]|nr:DUF721 domain-containing protein [Treponema sp.]
MSEIRNFSDIAISIMSNLTESERSLPSIWKKVVSKVNKYGDRLCGNTRVVDYKNGVLLIETDHPGWNQIMNIYQKFIITGLNRELPDLKINTLAFRVKGNDAQLSQSYDEFLEEKNKEYQEKLEKDEKEIDKFYENLGKNREEEKKESSLPPEILEKFERLKQSMLTNDEK